LTCPLRRLVVLRVAEAFEQLRDVLDALGERRRG